MSNQLPVVQLAVAVPGVQGPMGPIGPIGPIGPPAVAGTIPSGSVSQPGLAFSGDTDTGIYQPGPDRFAFTTSGVLSCEVDAQGDFRYYGDAVFDDGGTYATTVQVVTPTANRTLSFPDATGTIALVAGSSGQLIVNRAGAYSGVTTLTADASGHISLSGRLVNSYTSIADNPAQRWTGVWFSGGTSTTTKPHTLIEPAGVTSTGWSTNGTGLGVNAPSGFAGPLVDLQQNGTSEWSFSASGLTIGEANNITIGTVTGTKIGTATTQKIGFYDATPVTQPAAVANITTTTTSGSLPSPDGSVTIADATTPTVAELLEYCVELEAKLEAVLTHLRTLGLIAT
jgi:hypothetical protein